MAAALILLDAQRTDSPWQRGDAFRVNLAHEQRLRMRRRGDAIAAGVAHDAAGYRITLDDRSVRGERGVDHATRGVAAFIDGEPFRCGTCATVTICT